MNLIAGGALTLAFMNKAKQDKIALPRTGEELRRDRDWLASLPSGKAGATSTPEGEPMTAERNEPLRH